MTPTFIGEQVASTTTAIGSGLTLSLPAILGIFAALVALGIAVRYVKRWIGRK